MKNKSFIASIVGILACFLLVLFSRSLSLHVLFNEYNGIQVNELLYVAEFNSITTSIQLISLMLFVLCIIIFSNYWKRK